MFMMTMKDDDVDAGMKILMILRTTNDKQSE